MARTSTLVRLSGNNQVAIPKTVRVALGLQLGDLFEASAVRGGVFLKRKVVTDAPEAEPTAREIRALDRVIAADQRGETITHDDYRAQRAARLGGRLRPPRRKATR